MKNTWLLILLSVLVLTSLIISVIVFFMLNAKIDDGNISNTKAYSNEK